MSTQFLDKIDSPKDLKKLKPQELLILANELRQRIIDIVSVHGGHFASSLGVVELTVALHYVFNAPEDLLVWDVGHQAYGHKILTGRRDNFITNRKYKGISGFPKRSESVYDAFGVGHASTSISAALGMSMASRYLKEFKQVVAIIGDGAMTGGMAFEAMNHAGVSGANMLIILNDNRMSIDPNMGALQAYLTSITSSQFHNKIRDEVWQLLSKMPIGKSLILDIAHKMDIGLKGFIHKHSNLFEALKIRYFGTIDGHNTLKLVEILEKLKHIEGIKLLHIITTKGKGYRLAEEKQTIWHAPGFFDKNTGEIKKSNTSTPPKYQDVFGHTIIELAQKNPKIFGITPAMPSGSSLKFMIEAMPERAFDVDICEQHAVTLSAGMATQGLRVFCNIYSSFMQRAYDQVIHDVALQKLPVIFCLDRAGLVGEDGATHHGNYDLAYMRCIPNLIIASPLNEHELRHLMYTAQLEHIQQPFVIRYPRGNGVFLDWKIEMQELEIGKGRCITEANSEIAILSLGPIGNHIIQINEDRKAQGKSLIAHYDMRFLKPLDANLLREICAKHKQLISLEDGTKIGGFGSAIGEFLLANKLTNGLHIIGIPDRIVEHGTVAELQKECEMDIDSIGKIIEDYAK